VGCLTSGPAWPRHHGHSSSHWQERSSIASAEPGSFLVPNMVNGHDPVPLKTEGLLEGMTAPLGCASVEATTHGLLNSRIRISRLVDGGDGEVEAHRPAHQHPAGLEALVVGEPPSFPRERSRG
jgi:hypothetical protein